jgi:flagellar motor switch/type III secretory pathway protein FliN
MSGAGIVSEAIADAGEPLPWLPAPLGPGESRADDGDFGPFLTAAARALTRLFGAEVHVLPGRASAAGAAPGAARVAEPLAALLMTVRMGGDPARAGAIAPGSAGQRYAAAIAATLDDVARRVWPPDDRGGFDLDIACGAIAGHAHVPAPPPLPVDPAAPRVTVRVDDLPLRIRVELASADTLVSALLPLRAGLVVPIDPEPEMPLLIGEHRIGRAIVASLADGRQQATIVAIAVTPQGGRP